MQTRLLLLLLHGHLQLTLLLLLHPQQLAAGVGTARELLRGRQAAAVLLQVHTLPLLQLLLLLCQLLLQQLLYACRMLPIPRQEPWLLLQVVQAVQLLLQCQLVAQQLLLLLLAELLLLVHHVQLLQQLLLIQRCCHLVLQRAIPCRC